MRKAMFYKLFGVAAAVGLLAGCATQGEGPPPGEHSGFLTTYSNLQEVSDSGEGKLYAWASPKLKPSNYNAMMVVPVEFYPKAEPTAQVSQQTLDGIRNYTTEALTRAVRSKTRVVTSPGRGVVKLQVAITGVAPEKAELHAYQYIPIAFVVTMAKRGVEGQAENAKLVIESLATDSVTGEVLYKSVRSGTGKELAKATGSEERVVTVDDLKPLLDNWAENATKTLNKYVAR